VRACDSATLCRYIRAREFTPAWTFPSSEAVFQPRKSKVWIFRTPPRNTLEPFLYKHPVDDDDNSVGGDVPTGHIFYFGILRDFWFQRR
jgi:hypothetical protein